MNSHTDHLVRYNTTGPELAAPSLRARHQSAVFGLFGFFMVVVAVADARGETVTAPFLLIAGGVVGGLAWVRTAKRLKQLSVDSNTDGGLYIGLLLGAVVAAVALSTSSPADWLLPGLLIAVVVFVAAMARFEANVLGLTVALSLAAIGAVVGAVQAGTLVAWTLLAFSTMLVSGAYAVSAGGDARA